MSLRTIALKTFALLPAILCAGCVNLYTHVDRVPAEGGGPGTVEERFAGIADYLRDRPALHVLQMHGMGDHRFEDDCGPASANIALQARIAARMAFVEVPESAVASRDIMIGDTLGGRFSTRHYARDGKHLYFSCLGWGEASRTLKRRLLGLNDDFTEDNAHERHRALLNREAKRFVNEKFSDPVIYLGRFGPFLQRVVLQGIAMAGRTHQDSRSSALRTDATMGATAALAADFYDEVDTLVISDSLGSRVVFDVLCGQQPCNGVAAAGTGPDETPASTVGPLAVVAERAAISLQGIYMFANQLPLLELAFVDPPNESTSLDTILESGDCFGPGPEPMRASLRSEPVQVIAFTDANDALSYYLGESFRRRCGSRLHIVNVTMPNARLRWGFVYAHLPKAHSSGFKAPRNRKALRYLVDGNHPLARR